MVCNDTLCAVCTNNPQCRQCKRRLPPGLFPAGEDTCKTCQRKRDDGTRRTALNGIVIEEDLHVAETGADVEVFLQENADQMMAILHRALEDQMQVTASKSLTDILL